MSQGDDRDSGKVALKRRIMTPDGSAAILLAREECPYCWPNILARSRDMGKTMIFLDPTNRRLWDAPSPAGVPRILRDRFLESCGTSARPASEGYSGLGLS